MRKILVATAALIAFGLPAFAEVSAEPQTAIDQIIVKVDDVSNDAIVMAAVQMDVGHCAPGMMMASADGANLLPPTDVVEANALPVPDAAPADSAIVDTVLAYDDPMKIFDDETTAAWTEAGEAPVLTASRDATDQKITLGGNRTVALTNAPLTHSSSGPLSEATIAAMSAGGVKVTDQARSVTA